MGDGGAMGGRTAGCPQQGREMEEVHLLDMLIREIMEILHTTGIHEKLGDPKKVRKKGPTFCPPKKVRLEGSPFFQFILWWIRQAIPK